MSTASLGGSKIFGEVRVNLKITFPTLDNEALEVRAKPHKLLSQVILHVLQKLQGIFHLTYSRLSSYITVGIMIDELDVRDADSNESIHLDTIVSTMKTNAITVQKASDLPQVYHRMGLKSELKTDCSGTDCNRFHI